MINVLQTFLSALLNLGIAALIPVGLFIWLIWFFVRLFLTDRKRINKNYRQACKNEKKWLKSRNEALVKLGIDPKEFDKRSTEEKMKFWESLPEDKLKELGLGTEIPE